MRRLIIMGAVCLAALATARAITIQVDYDYDNGFFAGNAQARAAVEKAAADLGAVITSTLNPVTTNLFTGTNGPTSITLDWSVFFNNPSNSATEVEITDFGNLFPANTIRMFVGSEALGGPLGVGGPAGAGYGQGGSGFNGQFGAAFAAAASLSNAAIGRGAGPVIGSFDHEVEGVARNLQVGSIAGKLSINSTTNWHFDINSDPMPGTFDLYTVALHEMMHAIGFGTSDSWDDNLASNASNLSWFGPEVIALLGTGEDVLSSGRAHIAADTLSPDVMDLMLQSVVMDPALGAGVRKNLTELDLAFLRDMGFETIAVPEPSAVTLFALTAFAFAGGFAARRRRTA